MGIFSRAAKVSTDEKVILALLSRGVAEIIGKDELHKKLTSGVPLRIKLGIDPTSPDLHIGRAVSLLKLRDFQELGHHIVLIVGDFTAVIGDTSDKDAERPMLQREVIEKNKKTYFDQVGKILDLSKTELRYNSEWLEPLTYREIGEHADVFSVADFIARDVIRRRLDLGKRVSLREMLYPLMQGYDSVAVKADVEIGGMDQKFNLLAGRTLQEKYKQPPQNIVMSPLIEGLDGTKMSSSKGNVITLTAPASDMYGKVMSMTDAQLGAYFELCTRVPTEEIKEILLGHPKEAKMRLAKEIVTLYHGKEAAESAEEDFTSTFSKGEVPGDAMRVVFVNGIRETLVLAGVLKSNSEFTRLADAGAIRDMNSDEKITDPLAAPIDKTLRIGKHRFVKIVKN